MRRSPLRICFVCNEYPPGRHGGIGTMTQVLGRALVAAGHRVRVIGMYAGAEVGWGKDEDQGVEVWRLRGPFRRGGWFLRRWQLYRRIREWSRRGEIDLVEIPDWEGMAAGWPRLGVPVLARLNGSAAFFRQELGQHVGGLGIRLERYSARRVDFWCAVTRYVAEVSRPLLGLRGDPRAILSNPVERQGGGIADRRGTRDVVFSGTLTPKKGILSLAKAWPGVQARCPGAVLHVFGKDESGQGARMLAESGGSASTIRLHGHVTRERLLGALKSARLGVFPSFAESFGIAPIESMMCGCPTIYTRLGPGPELLRHRVDALLIDPRRPEELRDAMIEVLEDAELAQSLSRTGQQVAEERYSIDALLPQNVACFEACMQTYAGHS